MSDLIERLEKEALGVTRETCRELNEDPAEWELEILLSEAAAELARLTAEVERLRVELRECNCPRPINTATDESTAWCVDNGYCGCGRNVLLGVEKGHGYAAIKEAGNG